MYNQNSCNGMADVAVYATAIGETVQFLFAWKYNDMTKKKNVAQPTV